MLNAEHIPWGIIEHQTGVSGRIRLGRHNHVRIPGYEKSGDDNAGDKADTHERGTLDD